MKIDYKVNIKIQYGVNEVDTVFGEGDTLDEAVTNFVDDVETLFKEKKINYLTAVHFLSLVNIKV